METNEAARLYPCDFCMQASEFHNHAGGPVGVCCGDCALFAIPERHACARADCRLNDDSNCALGLYECCGAWRDPDET